MGVSDLLSSISSGRSSGPTPTIEEVGIVLKNCRRRMTLYAIAEADEETLRLGDISEVVASAEYEKAPDHLDSAERKRVYISLRQTHLPRLDQMDIVEFNRDRGTLEAGPKFEETLRILETVADECVEESNRGELA